MAPPLRLMCSLVVAALLAAGCSQTNSADETFLIGDCTRQDDGAHSVARVWDEALLDAIRRDFPAPTVHARNLFHTSAAMWDAWAAYDPTAIGYFIDEAHQADDATSAREAAISFAAYRILGWRYADAFGAEDTLSQLDKTMADLCYSTDFTSTSGDSPAALGNRIAATVIEFGGSDGSLEADRYVDSAYEAVNEPMVIIEAGTTMTDPNRWQPLAFEVMETQNGLGLQSNVQEFVGPHWGNVTPFALAPAPEGGIHLDPGDPPYLGDPTTDEEFKQAAVELLRYSALLDATDGVEVDIGPASAGNSPAGSYNQVGRAQNPTTGSAYAPNVVARGDFARIVAEFWADGPNSETPPGHWNTLANNVSDHPETVRRIGGTGAEVDRLEWDVKLYFALNGAGHDAAIASWGSKSYYDYARPISMIRHMGGLGQSTDPDGLSYHRDGLPLVPGLVEVITPESSAQGERHEALDRRIGQIAVRTWQGNPGNPETGLGGVGWIRAVRWVPYQKQTFVTPAFAAYVSGHSAFSRAAAEVMAAFTGDEFFPGGIGEWTIPAEELEFEAGPETDITLQWATYIDAADQAGASRLYGGIHVPADDLAGRIIGATCGQDAWLLASSYYDGSVSR